MGPCVALYAKEFLSEQQAAKIEQQHVSLLCVQKLQHMLQLAIHWWGYLPFAIISGWHVQYMTHPPTQVSIERASTHPPTCVMQA